MDGNFGDPATFVKMLKQRRSKATFLSVGFPLSLPVTEYTTRGHYHHHHTYGNRGASFELFRDSEKREADDPANLAFSGNCQLAAGRAGLRCPPKPPQQIQVVRPQMVPQCPPSPPIPPSAWTPWSPSRAIPVSQAFSTFYRRPRSCRVQLNFGFVGAP